MERELWIAAGILLAAVGVCAGLAVYFWKQKKKLGNEIQEMLEDASAGCFRERHLDESQSSAVENSMWQYLCGRELREEKIQQETREIKSRISDLSHQAVLPVSNILLYSQLLEEQLKEENADTAEELSVIREEAKKLDFFLEELVKLSRLETGIIQIRARRQKLAPVLETVNQQFKLRARQKGILLTVEGTEAEAVFDSKWTVEALSNLVDNGLKYTPEGGKVRIQTVILPSMVRVDVSDTGRGICEEEQAAIFGRFYRSQEMSEKPGMGIGLYAAREIMRAQNGYIQVQSRPGKGSVFSVYFLREKISQN